MEELGRYLVRGQIGKGGFGAVYRAWDPLVGREVAIKLLTSVHDPSMLARFRFEAGTTGKLKHKNIVTIYDFGVHEAAPYLVMELLDGRSLREVIESAVPLSLLDKVAILAEIARGLMYAHQNGVIHRDVKPANVMQVVDGTVKILDFGIARMADPDLSRQTSTGVLVGTPLYMAPEQFAGEDATAVSDIFSFGVLGYELLCGEHPFRAPNPVATMNLVSNKELTPLRESIADYPAPLDSVLLKAVAKRPSERYQSLQDLLFDLAPIEAQLRRNHADCQAQEAQRWLAGGDLASAQQSLWRALEADPSHARSHELRREIQCRRDRIVLEQRFQAAVRELEELLQRGCFDEAIAGLESVRELVSTDEAGDLRADLDARFDAARAGRERVRQIAVVQAAVRESEELLQRGCFDEAIAGLESVRELLSTDGAGDLRADLDARLVAARAGRERVRQIAALLAEARQAAEHRDFAVVSRASAAILSIEPHNRAALELADWAAAEEERARVEVETAETERRHCEELQHCEELRMLTERVHEELAVLRFDDASRILESALQLDPGEPEILALQSMVSTARESHVSKPVEVVTSEQEQPMQPEPAENLVPEPVAAEPLPVQNEPRAVAPDASTPKINDAGIQERFAQWSKAWMRLFPRDEFVYLLRPAKLTEGTEAEPSDRAVDRHLSWRERLLLIPLPSSRRGRLIAIGCGLVLVSYIAGLVWLGHVTVDEMAARAQRSSLRNPSPGAQPPAATLPKPTPPVAAPSRETHPQGASTGFYWQVVATVDRDLAKRTLRKLKDKRFPAFIKSASDGLRVLVGPYPDAMALQRAKAELQAAGFLPVRH